MGAPLTEDDLLALPEEPYRHELVEGFLVRDPAPAPGHWRIQRRLLEPLIGFVEAGRLGEAFAEVSFVLSKEPDTVRAPDVAFVSTQSLARLRDEMRLFPGAPDLAVEIRSRSNRRQDIRSKVADYLAAGTRLVWVVDPARRRVTAYRTLLAPRLLGEHDLLDGADVVPGFSLPVSALFSR